MGGTLRAVGLGIGKVILPVLLLGLLVGAVRRLCCITFTAVNPQHPGSFILNGAYMQEVSQCIARY